MRMSRPASVVITLVVVLAVVFVVYGLKTDCPRTAGYVFCSDSEGWHLWGTRKGGVN